MSTKEDKVRVEGKVLAVLPDTKYRVEINVGGFKHELIGYISGKMRQHYIKVAAGDEVTLEMSPNDLSIARIVYKKDTRRLAQALPTPVKPVVVEEVVPEVIE